MPEVGRGAQKFQDSSDLLQEARHIYRLRISLSFRQKRDDWELDSNFFAGLSQWTHDNSGRMLNDVLDEVNKAIDGGGTLPLWIEHPSFPARRLIGALTDLLLLGVKITRTTLDVQAFAGNIIRLVSEMQHTIESSGKGGFTRTTWKYMRNVRILIDEICKWAGTRLVDNRWSRTGDGLRIASEITEFKTRITFAQGLLPNLGQLDSSGHALKGYLFFIFHQQPVIIREIRKIRKIQSKQISVNYVDEALAQIQAMQRLRSTMTTLSSHAVTNVAYNQQGKRLCAKGTRIDIRTSINQWIHNISMGSQNFLWLTGSPGCGKSTITASIARDCEEEGTLWAQLFINRNNINATNPNFYFPSIARQLASRSETVEHRIHDALEEDPSLMNGISIEQATRLFVNAVAAASKLDPQKPVVVVIDALDETEESRLEDVATIFSQLFDALLEYPNVKILISSRPQDEIFKPFTGTMRDKSVLHIPIDTQGGSSNEDIVAYLKSQLAEIAEKYDLPPSWPGEERICTLSTRASGLFIWAVTAVKFIDDQLERGGVKHLDSVFDTYHSKSDIASLYGFILSSAYPHGTDHRMFELFRRIIGSIAILQEPLNLSDLSSLLALRRHPQDICEFINRLRTILVAGTDHAIDIHTVPRLHRSFFEFITSERAEPCFRISPESSNRDLSLRCLQLLSSAHDHLTEQHISPISTSLPGPLRYAFLFWSSHLEMSHLDRTPAGVAIVDNHTVDLPELRNTLQLSPNSSTFGPLCMSWSPDKSQFQISLDNRRRIYEVATGQPVEKMSNPATFRAHEKPLTSVAFSPSRNQPEIASSSWDNTIIIWDAITGRPKLRPIVGHTKAIWSVAFSPDGKQLVSGSWDRTVRHWDAKTGMAIGSPFIGHTNLVSSVAFSPNGKQIISGSWDQTIRLWDVQTGQPIGTPFTGHTDWVWSVAYSHDGQRILSSSHDKTIRIWDAYSGQCIGIPFKGHTRGVTSIAFSPDDKQIISGSEDRTIRIWETDTGRPLGPPLLHFDKRVWSVAFSPNGKQVAVGCEDGAVHIWDTAGMRSVAAKLVAYAGPVYSVAFAPDGESVASGSGDHTVRVWKVPATPLDPRSLSTAFSPRGEKTVVISSTASLKNTLRVWDREAFEEKDIGLLLEGESNFVARVAFAQNGTRIAAASVDGNVYLWDATTRRLLDVSSSKDSSPTYPTSSPNTLAFISDDKGLVVGFADGTMSFFREEKGKLFAETKSGFPSIVQDQSSFFDLERVGWIYNDQRWFPSKNPNSGLWAYVDGHIIRGRADGSITVVPVDHSRESL